MNGSSKKSNKNNIVPALLIAGGACGMLPSTLAAFELGQLQVQSTLGQPLRASIAYALNPNEQLHNFCISLRSGVADDGLQYLSRARITITDTDIVFTSELPMREPMLAMQVSVSCPYTAHLARSYTLMIDPAASARPEAVVDAAQAAAAPAARVTRTVEATRATRPEPSPASVAIDQTPIANASRYQVQPGDSLSAIVLRIADRPAGMWPSVDAIFATNPHAFIDGDRNLLKAGSWLDIPDLHQASAALPAAKPEPVYEPAAAESQETATAYTSYEPPSSAGFDSGSTSPAEEIATPLESDPPAEAAAESDTVEEVKPGDVFIGSDSPFVSPIDNAESAAETNAAAPGGGDEAAPQRAVPVVVTSRGESSTSSSDESRSWLMWMAGSGIAIILGLLVFARRLRGRFGSTPTGVDAQPAEERREPEAAQETPSISDVDFQFDVSTPAIDAISLDADLDVGTGLQENSDIDVAQDFGFTTSGEVGGEVDMELPEHAALPDESGPTTEIIPPNHVDESSILESEVPPQDDETGEYDLSMIVDATKQPLDNTHLTAKDLNAVQIDPGDADNDSGQYELKKEVDYGILEQDYEEELTQTQALNQEIAKAAIELAATMDDDERDAETAEVPAGDPAEFETGVTREMPAVAETDATAEITAEMTAQLPPADVPEEDEELSDLDDTGVNEELTVEMPGDDVTAQMPAAESDKTAEMPAAENDDTAEMPSAKNDPTVEMQVEGGRVDTKKSVG